jgi:hypothetical protein
MSNRIAIATGGLAAFSVYMMVQAYRTVPPQGQSLVAYYETRMANVKKSLAPHEVVGFLMDETQDPGEARTRHEMTQYVLVPVVVANDAERPLVIGDFRGPDLGAKRRLEKKLVLVEDFGDGVQLLRPGER